MPPLEFSPPETASVFRGLIAYPITPLLPSGAVDHEALGELVVRTVEAGVSAISVLATSGAGVTFSRTERQRVQETTMAAVAGAVPVYAAVTAASTRESENYARDAESGGLAGVLLAPFAYVPLTRDAVRALFSAVSDASALPICFYNKPAQLSFDVDGELLAELVAQARVRGIKEPSVRPGPAGQPPLARRMRELCSGTGPELAIGLSGDLGLLDHPPVVDAWHTGLAALLPEEYVRVWAERGALAVDNSPARDRLIALASALAAGSSPLGGLHAAARALGIGTADPRGPYLPATAREAAALEAVLAA